MTSAIVSALGKLETLLDRGNSQSEEAMGLFMMVATPSCVQKGLIY